MHFTLSTRSRHSMIGTCVTIFLLHFTGEVAGKSLEPPWRAQDALELRFEEFLVGFDTLGTTGFVVFFPKRGDFTYTHTIHTVDGDRVAEWRFPAGESLAALSGPLWQVFTVQWEGQPIGYLAHHVLERPGKWRRINATRFVPPGADSTSATFVEWRLEDSQWVIAEIGDEHFPSSVPPPCWLVECDA